MVVMVYIAMTNFDWESIDRKFTLNYEYNRYLIKYVIFESILNLCLKNQNKYVSDKVLSSEIFVISKLFIFPQNSFLQKMCL